MLAILTNYRPTDLPYCALLKDTHLDFWPRNE